MKKNKNTINASLMSIVAAGVPTKDPPPTTNNDKTIKDFPELLHPVGEYQVVFSVRFL